MNSLKPERAARCYCNAIVYKALYDNILGSLLSDPCLLLRVRVMSENIVRQSRVLSVHSPASACRLQSVASRELESAGFTSGEFSQREERERERELRVAKQAGLLTIDLNSPTFTSLLSPVSPPPLTSC